MTRRLVFLLLMALMMATVPCMQSCKSAKKRDADEAYERGDYNYSANI